MYQFYNSIKFEKNVFFLSQLLPRLCRSDGGEQRKLKELEV